MTTEYKTEPGTETPRTDVAEIDNSHFADWGTGPSGYVEADFARTIERESTALTAEVQRLREALEGEVAEHEEQASLFASVDESENADYHSKWAEKSRSALTQGATTK